MARQAGYKPRPETEEEDIKNKYKQGKFIKDIANEYNTNYNIIYNVLKRNDIKLRTKQKYSIDYNFFEIGREEFQKAYWLGFLTGDGCLCNNQISVRLSAKDKDHLEKFRRALKTIKPIIEGFNGAQSFKPNSPYVNFFICNKKMADDLRLIFDRERMVPIFKRDGMMSHFIRGVFDSDGCVCLINKKQIKSHLHVTLLGKKLFLYDIKQNLPFYCDNMIGEQHNIHHLSFTCSKALKFLKWIYKDTTPEIRLERKYSIYKDYLRTYNEVT